MRRLQLCPHDVLLPWAVQERPVGLELAVEMDAPSRRAHVDLRRAHVVEDDRATLEGFLDFYRGGYVSNNSQLIVSVPDATQPGGRGFDLSWQGDGRYVRSVTSGAIP